ncbi:hemerythrin domain-containing protein [Sphingomonas sp.]|uniref:hemerythrin domain-containing protein n=1 Tax=Sphingomonas sp. TaxID=28214 RepID=UPI001D92D1D9|nr:hemerythrin domain-containing protein [Sphingomonas sp.]MBX9796098.1 hemerythrin domain-containing protein [Sphingomonas sp.]
MEQQSPDPARLRAEHDALARRVAGVRQLLEPAAPNPRRVLGRLRALRVALAEHLAHEDSELYPQLVGGADPAAAAIGMHLRCEYDYLTGDWNLYLLHWRPARIAADWAGFVEDSRAMMARLDARIARENALLYPLLVAC